MKVDKKKFYEALEYIQKINSTDIEKLDLDEFKRSCDYRTPKEWDFTGLNNRDYITCCFV
jgi:hypothetical protein